MKNKYSLVNRTSASALMTALILLVVLSALVTAALTFTSGSARMSQRSRAMEQALAVGDGALQLLYADWKAQSRANSITNPATPLTTFTSSANCLPTATEFPGLQSYSAGANRLMINPATFDATPITLSGTSTEATGASPAVTAYYYLASADVTAPALRYPVTARVRRVFEQKIDNAWRYLTFFEYDLEIQPGPGNQMITNGDIHTNGIFYAGSEYLTVMGLPTTVKGFVNYWAPGDSQNEGNPVGMPDFQGGPPLSVPREDLLGVNPSQFNTTDSNKNNDSYREMIERVNTGAGAGTDTFAGARVYDQAGIKILIDASNNLTIMDQAGTIHTTDTFATTLTNAITTNQTFQDTREAATVRVATIDVSKITAAVNAGTLNFNGIIYIADTSAAPSATPPVKRGVRLWRGAKLPSTGLTVATANPLYVWGDYNTGGSYPNATATAPSTQPASNTDGGPADAANTVGAYTAAPAAIFSDATSILSNAWLDSNSTKSLSQRNPANTTINAGIVSGSVPTDPNTNTYGLGMEGLIRLLENWKPSDLGMAGPQKRFSYYGSLISLWRAEQATGLFTYGVVSTAPFKFLNFDTNFLTNPPKPFLGVMTFSKGRWYLQ